MLLSLAETRRIARLARLELAEAELAPLAQQLAAILEHVGRLPPLGASSPASSESCVPAPRADQVRRSLSAEAALAQAPQQRAGYFVVPKVVE